MPRESPTRIRSAPPASAMQAVGTSYAVTMARGGVPPLRTTTPGTVIGEREAGGTAAPVVQVDMRASFCVQRPAWAAGEKRLTAEVYRQRDQQPGAEEDGGAEGLAPPRGGVERRL